MTNVTFEGLFELVTLL